MKTFKRFLEAGESTRIVVAGRHVRGMEAVGEFAVGLNGGAPVKLQRGVGYTSREGFSSVDLLNTRSFAQEIEIIVSDGDVSDSRLIASGGIQNVAASAVGAFGSVAVAAVAAVIVPHSSSRSSVLVQNSGSVPVFIGLSSSVTASNGIKIDAGGAMSLTVAGDVYAVTSGAAGEVRVLEELV